MELINSPEFDFKEQLADYEANSLKTLSDFEPEDLMITIFLHQYVE